LIPELLTGFTFLAPRSVLGQKERKEYILTRNVIQIRKKSEERGNKESAVLITGTPS
jgi:hypothetical protein